MKIVEIKHTPSPLGRSGWHILVETSSGKKGEIVAWALGSCALNNIQGVFTWLDEDFIEAINWLPTCWENCREFARQNGGNWPSHDMKCFLYTNGEYYMDRYPQFVSHPKVKKAFTVKNHAHGGHPVSTYLIDVS